MLGLGILSIPFIPGTLKHIEIFTRDNLRALHAKQ